MIIALVGQKGGVGKTSLAINLATTLHAAGERVLLVDADPQGTAITWGAIANEQGHPMPSLISMGDHMHRPDQLPAISQGYGWTIIDCPGREGSIQRSAMMVAQLLLLPCSPSPADIWALTSSIDHVKEATGYRPEIKARFIISRVKSGTEIGRQIRKILEESEFETLLPLIADRVAYQEALAAGQGITQYAPGTKAAREIELLVKNLQRLKEEG